MRQTSTAVHTFLQKFPASRFHAKKGAARKNGTAHCCQTIFNVHLSLWLCVFVFCGTAFPVMHSAAQNIFSPVVSHASHIPQPFPPMLFPQPQQHRRRIRMMIHEQSSVFAPPTLFPHPQKRKRRMMIQRMLLPSSQLLLLQPKKPIVIILLKTFGL